jgi:signal transduction histidine kinase
MFEKVRKRTSLNQIGVIAVALVLIFAFSCVYNYTRMTSDVDKRLDNLRQIKFFTGAETQSALANQSENARDSLIIKVYADGRYLMSDANFYSEQTIARIILTATKAEGRITVGSYRIAYVKDDASATDYYTLYLYDYSSEFNSFVYNILTLLLTGFVVMAVVAFFIIKFTNKNLVPVEEAFEKQQDLVANASHELKTPLTIINTNLSILNSSCDEMTDDQKKWLAGIATQANRMSTMINEMLELARFEAVREKNYEKVNFSEIVESVVLETDALAFERKIIFTSDVAPGVIITARRADIEKLVYSLVENAMKYTAPDGVISVKLTSEKRKATLRVRNTGEGIPRDKLPKLFDRFYRCDEAHTAGGSFGLGLAIAKAITDNNNGSIGVDSKIGEYTEFITVFKEI